MKRKLDAAVVTPGSFVIPSKKSSSVEIVVEQVSRRLGNRLKLVVVGRKSRLRPAKERCNGVHYRRVPAPSPRVYIQSVSRLLKPMRPRLIQVENRPRFARLLRRKHPKSRIWLSLHSITFVSRPHMGRKELRRCLAAVDRIIVNSQFLGNEIARRVPEARGKIKVNYLGVDPDRFVSRWTEEGAVKREQFLEKQGLTGKKIIVYVGRLIPIKGVHHLLEAMPEIVARVPNAMLLVVGSAYYGSSRVTPYVRRLQQMAAGFKANVRFIPYVPHDEVDDWFRLGDVLVVPSSRNEAFGLVNVEAMAAGVPVVASRAGGMPEIIAEGVTGFTVEPELIVPGIVERVSRLLLDEPLARQLGECSVQRVREHFTWSCTADRWVSMVQEK
ncbi:glycosyltransferase family 4 protein [Paenibacillus sp. YYML68]|uniref:glycosyltransferase family 4 protein n=1 Tax=Paenibacillus sp. YYML68 TaxID=2909250 RepID=UPI0024903B86|nr:glycosyltransferase family 4 protein [Paenibacillus sp. YYML68]